MLHCVVLVVKPLGLVGWLSWESAHYYGLQPMVVEKLCCLTLLHRLSFLLILVVAILIVLQSKVASRRSYTEWIKKSTKNSGELDADIERILRGTREPQLESNSIQERLQVL